MCRYGEYGGDDHSNGLGVKMGVVLVVMDELFGGEWVVYSDREKVAMVEW